MNHKLLTPPAKVRWANLITPNRKFGTPGHYDVLVLLDPKDKDHAAFLSGLQEIWDGEYQEMCRLEGKRELRTHDKPWRAFLNKDGTDSGLIQIRPKNKEFFQKDGDTFYIHVDIVDAKKTPIKVEVGNDSICRVAITAFGFYHAGKFGVSLRLNAVQVLTLESAAYDWGFDEEEGYEGEPYEAPAGEPEEEKAPEPAPAAAEEFVPNDELPF